MHEEWRIKDPYQRRKAWSRLKSKWGRWRVWVRSVWERIERVFVERDRWELKKNHVLTIYRQIHNSMDQQVSIIKNSQMKLSRGIHSKVISMDRAAIETNSQKPRWIEIAIIAIEKGSSRGSIDSLAIERYWEAVEIAQKQIFKEEKNTDMNAIKHATQPKIQTTF